jgi:hypothetical protein
MSNKADIIPLREYLSSPPVFCGVRVAHLFGVLGTQDKSTLENTEVAIKMDNAEKLTS